MTEIKKINLWSFVKVIVIFGLIFGIISGILTSIYASTMANSLIAQSANPDVQAYLAQSGSDVSQMTASLQSAAKVAWFLVPILSAICSFIAAVLITLIYNLIAKKWGGIKLDFSDKK